LAPRAVNSSLRRKPPSEWITIAVPRIVSDEVYEAAQQQRERNRRLRHTAGAARYLLAGLVVCAQCGYAFHSASGGPAARGQRPYYRCYGTNALRFGGKRVCTNSPVRADKLDDHVWRSVCEVLRDPERVLQEWSRRLSVDDERAPLQAQHDEAKGSVERLEARVQRLLDAYEIGALSLEDFRTRSASIQERLRRARADLSAAETELAAVLNLRAIATRLEDFAEQVADGLEGLTREQRRDVIRMLVARVEIGAEKITVVFRVPRTSGPTKPSTPSPAAPTAPDRPVGTYGVRGRRRRPGPLSPARLLQPQRLQLVRQRPRRHPQAARRLALVPACRLQGLEQHP
jgi:site-specific DNA recombinase